MDAVPLIVGNEVLFSKFRTKSYTELAVKESGGEHAHAREAVVAELDD